MSQLTITKGKTLGVLLSENDLAGKLDLVAEYNWGTKVPAEINRALVELVGCETVDPDPLKSVLDPDRGTSGAIHKPEEETPKKPEGEASKKPLEVVPKLPATAVAITALPALFDPATETCTLSYSLEGNSSRADQKDFEIHATGYYAKVKDKEGGGNELVDKPSGTVTIDNVKETHILKKSEAAAPGKAEYKWDGASDAAVGVLKKPSKINSACAPYFVSVRYYKDSADKTAFIKMDPFYPRWNLTGKAKWDLDKESMVVKWELQGPAPSKEKLKNGQIQVYDKDGLVFFAPLTQDQIKGGTYNLLTAKIHLDKTKIDQGKLPYRIQIQAHSDDKEDKGLALAVMPTQVPAYNYEKVQFIGFNIRNDVALTDYLGHSDPDTDIDTRCKVMIEAIQSAKKSAETKNADRKVLKLFMAPEFYFRGKEGAYPVEKISTIIPKLREETDKHDYLDWLFVFGTALGYEKHEGASGVKTRHGAAYHRVEILLIDSSKEEITAKVWSRPGNGWKFKTKTQEKVISAPPGDLGSKDPEDGGYELKIKLDNTTGLAAGEEAYTVEPVMTIQETVPSSAASTDKLKVKSSLCGRIPIVPGTTNVVKIGDSSWEVASEGKTGKVTNVEYVPSDDTYILTLDSKAAYEAGKPMELVEPIASELFNVALIQKGWHAPHLGDGLRAAVTDKEFVSKIDFIRKGSPDWSAAINRKIRMHYTDNILLLPTEGGRDIGGASPNVDRGENSAVGSEINKSGLGGGCVIMVDRITFGTEVCLDHSRNRLFNFYTGATVRAGDPLVQVQLIPSWGMKIGASGVGKEVSAVPKGLVFNVDGARRESVARVWNSKYSCDNHVTVTEDTASSCTKDKITYSAGTRYYRCEKCSPPKNTPSPCPTHKPQCGETLRKIGTAFTASATIDIPLSNKPTYFNKAGNVQVFPPAALPDPDVAAAPAVLTSIANGSAKPGSAVEIRLQGTGLAQVRSVNVDGAGVTVNSFSVVSDTELTAKLKVSSGAKVEDRKVTASTFSGPSNAMVFKVAPLVVAVSSSSVSSS